MISAIQIVFFILIPVIFIIFRIKKSYTTSFAVYGIIASLVLGLLLMGTFLKETAVEFVELLNQDRYEEAKHSLRVILQKNPENVSKIEENKIIKKKAYDRIKSELESEYIRIVDKIMNPGTKESSNCKSLENVLKHQEELDHGMRLLIMAEAIGKRQDQKKEMLGSVIKRQKEIVRGLEDRCK